MLHGAGVKGKILKLGRSYTTFWNQDICFLKLIQGALWLQSGKNNGFTKISVEL